MLTKQCTRQAHDCGVITMNRFIATILILLFSSRLYGDCIARSYLKDEAPLYQLKSCQNSTEVIDAHLIEKGFNRPLESDKAVLVVPVNESASRIMRDKSEYWHYSGLCAELPIQKVVSLDLESHCSDLGITMHFLLGDITIKSAYEQKL